MKGRLFWGVALGIVVGAALAWTAGAPISPANAQQFAAPQYEYTVVRFVGLGETNHAKQLNQLTAAGWEYVGPILNKADADPYIGYVAFRRAARR